MERVIHKIILQPGLHTYALPFDSKILNAQFQRDAMCLWYDRPTGIAPCNEEHQLLFIGTGFPFPAGNWRHITTSQTIDQNFVFHVLELMPERG